MSKYTTGELEKLRELKNGLKGKTEFSLETIGDIAVIMEGKKKLKRMRWMMILTGLPVTRAFVSRSGEVTGNDRI